MKNLYNILIAVLVLLTIQESLSAQSLAGMKVYDTPGKFVNPKQGMDLTIGNPDKAENFRTTTYIVYSDRDNNQSYIEPNGREVKKEIGFLEQFYVVDEKGQYLHIVKDPAIEGKRLSVNAIDYGWVDKDNILMWSYALKNNRNIDRKALIINKISSVKDLAKNDILNSKVVFKSSPVSDIQTENESSVFEIFYVYKIEGDMVLLGDVGKIGATKAVRSIMQGWVPLSRLTLWESRLAVEPNWKDAACNERKSKGIKASIFVDESSAKKFIRKPLSVKEKDILWNNDDYQKRQNGYWFRFPILEKMSEMYSAGAMGNLIAYDGVTIQEDSGEGLTPEQKKAMETLKNKSNLNCVFVIDGTTSMQPYFDAVSKALEEAMVEIKNIPNYNVVKMKFGVVVYRDKPEGSRQFQTSSLTSDHTQVVSYLKNVKALDYSDTDAPESVYDGLTRAMQYLFQNDDQTNLMIHLGDAGNNEATTNAKSSDVIELMAQKRINYSVFQVANKGQNTYNEFSSQTESLIWNTAKKIYLDTKSTLGEESQQAKKMEGPELITKEENTTYTVKQIDNYPGGILTNLVYCKAPEIGSLTPTVLSSDIVKNGVTDIVSSSVDQFIKFKTHVENVVFKGEPIADKEKQQENKATESDSSNQEDEEIQSNADLRYTSSFNSAMLTLLSDAGLTPKAIDFLCAANFQMYQPGFAPIRSNELSHPLFKSVVLMSRQELFDLLNIFEELAGAFNASDQRKAMRNTWLELLKTNLGENEQDYLDMDLNAINKKVIGIEKTDETLMQVKLKDITSPEVFSDEEFNKYLSNISQKQFTLNKIANDDKYEFLFYSNNITYYWISIDLLP